MDASFSAEEHFRRGEAALGEECFGEALENFRAAHRLDPSSPRFRSYCGLSIGLAERRFDKALELCRAAAKEEFYNPDLYHNLARLHLAFGFKSEGIRYLRRALMIDPEHAATLADLHGLGTRRRPVLAFLPRDNPLNRLCGLVRQWLSRSSPTDPAPEPARQG